jgi:beta-lactam-binding protein with PASTA domain
MNKQEKVGPAGYLRSKDFRYTVIGIFVFMGIFMLISFLGLKFYTHHGQELQMPDYKGFQYDDAVKDARSKNFRISIQDSLHVLGKKGGEILKQNPAPGSLVKAKRMIYVTITKRGVDKILSGRLPEMYGKSFDRKKKELNDHFEIKSRIVDTRFDPGEPGQILEVRYEGKVIFDTRGRDNDVLIVKGDYLDFVVSAKSGGKVEVPNLMCKTYDEAQFLLENLGLKIGQVVRSGDIQDLDAAYIMAQFPTASGTLIEMDSEIQLTVTQTRPAGCN